MMKHLELDRYVSDNIETCLATNLIEGKIKDNSFITIDMDDSNNFYILEIKNK